MPPNSRPRSDRIRLALPDAPALSRIDPDAFAILARNLIENALKHGSPQEPVRVTLSSDGILSVAKAGPIVAPDSLARLSELFERGQAQADGAGHGPAIAARSDGRIELLSPPDGRWDGFEARLSIGT
ncbi:ATP-binding protein [Mesorhizobium sp. Root157]|uniref:ATP-binding protein n=1 Tax=Mesorhizobium sp. Root157 TaxID=1736477 RepID=UPI001FCE1AA6|nr:ATP-binding protein [Mesorhizobium sp. Root157]